MQFKVEYDDGVWLFTVESGEDEPDYREEFDISNLADAQAAAADLIEEIMEAYEAEDEGDDEEPFDDFVNDLDK
jgi:hypothetical protein